MTKPNETALVRSCISYLQAKGIMCWRNNSGGIQKGDHFIRFGQVGSADILGVLPVTGRMLAVECKMPKGKLTEHQADWLQRAKDSGALCIVARSLDDLMTHFE